MDLMLVPRRKFLQGAGSLFVAAAAQLPEFMPPPVNAQPLGPLISKYPNRICFMEQFGLKADWVPGGGTDNTPAWNAIFANATFGDTFVLPPGWTGFKTKPNKLPSGIKLAGSGAYSSMVRDYNSTDYFLTTGDSYPIFENILLWTGPDANGGIAFGNYAPNVNSASYRIGIKNLVITAYGAGRWNTAVLIDGTAGPPHYGSRAHVIDGLFIGNACSETCLRMGGVNGVNVSNYICASPGWGIWITGHAGNPSNSIKVDGVVNTNILCYWTRNMVVEASSLDNVILDNDCISNVFRCSTINQVPSLGGINNHVYAGAASFHSAS